MENIRSPHVEQGRGGGGGRKHSIKVLRIIPALTLRRRQVDVEPEPAQPCLIEASVQTRVRLAVPRPQPGATLHTEFKNYKSYSLETCLLLYVYFFDLGFCFVFLLLF